MVYDDFLSFMRAEVLPRRAANPDHIRLDGATTGGSRDVVGRFRHNDLAWVVHADRHAAELYGYAVRVLRDHDEADEALQETFVRAWRSADRYDASRPLRPWLFAILRNVVVDQTRKRSRRLAPDADPDGLDASVEAGLVSADNEVERVIDQWVLAEALRRIRADQRTVLVETVYRGRSYADVAAELGVPDATARTRAFYGLRALRLVLEEMGWAR